MKIYSHTLVLITLLFICINCENECPKPEVLNPELLKPCFCDNNSITCIGDESFSIKTIFNRLSNALEKGKKHFYGFFLNNTAITEIPEFTFQDITFNYIGISSATNLSLIHTNAFNTLNFVINGLRVESTPLRNIAPNYDIFTAISHMVNIEKLYLVGTDITEIPDLAFKPINGPQLMLRLIKILHNNNLNRIGNNAFNYLSSLTHLELYGNKLNHISENAFHILSNSENTLNLNIISNLLSSSSFEVNAFSQLNRPTNLFLDVNNITFLDQHVFEPFLKIDKRNKIYYDNLDCNDCRSFWAFNNTKYNTQITIKCSNDHIFTDNKNFDNC